MLESDFPEEDSSSLCLFRNTVEPQGPVNATWDSLGRQYVPVPTLSKETAAEGFAYEPTAQRMAGSKQTT